MPEEVKDHHSAAQIENSLGRRSRPKSVVLGIQRRVNTRFGLQRVCSWGGGQGEATA